MRTDKASYLETFFDSYVETALWADGPTTQDTDEKMSVDDIAQESLDDMSKECSEFVDAEWGYLRDIDPLQAGGDFWLTRNGHGAGYWDRGLGAKGQWLTQACKVYGTSDLYVGDDGKVYVQ